MISYAPLFETMAQKGITSYRLEKMGFSRATYYSIKCGNSVSTNQPALYAPALRG